MFIWRVARGGIYSRPVIVDAPSARTTYILFERRYLSFRIFVPSCLRRYCMYLRTFEGTKVPSKVTFNHTEVRTKVTFNHNADRRNPDPPTKKTLSHIGSGLAHRKSPLKISEAENPKIRPNFGLKFGRILAGFWNDFGRQHALNIFFTLLFWSQGTPRVHLSI